MSTAHKPERDIIKRAFRVLNLQACVALVATALLPYLVSWNILDELVTDTYYMGRGYSRVLRDEFLAAPDRQHALALAANHRVLIAVEGPEGRWYTDGDKVYPVGPNDVRPYYRGLYNAYDQPDGSRVVVTFPAAFFDLHTHLRVFLSWIGAPLL